MARGELILRQWNLLKMLQTRGEGMPLRDIAEAFEVSERTVQRDFEVLQELGFPIEFEEDEFGKRFWRLPHDFFRTGPLVVGITEAISLHLAERMLDPLAGTMLAEGLQSMLDKIRSLVPARALDYFAELDNTVHVRRLGTTDYTAHADTIRVLHDAMLARN
jgi:predicted DNA-binding transcriptional regulator YafY